MTKDLAWVARMAADLPKDLQAAQRRGVAKGALHVTGAIRGEVRQASGGDSRLSGVGRRGTRVGAKYTVKGDREPTALIKATGPMQLLERDTKPHKIAPRRRRGQSKKKRALRLADGSFVAAVDNHPGTKGKAPFEKGYLKSRGDTGRIFDREVQAGIGRALR